MKKVLIFGTIVTIFVVIAGAALSMYLRANRESLIEAGINSFEECEAYGYSVMESYPRQCRTAPKGRTFIEVIGNELEKVDLIRVNSPRPYQMISSPLAVEGEARGTWFFEASFPIKLFDGDGKEITYAIAQAQGEWMTTEFVPFRATLEFSKPATPNGTLVLEKDNPSGLPEHADQLIMPVRFQ